MTDDRVCYGYSYSRGRLSESCCEAEGVAGSFKSAWVARMEQRKEGRRKKVKKLTKNPVNCTAKGVVQATPEN